MRISRRGVLAGSAAMMLAPNAADALLPRGTGVQKGWNTLPLGGGGLITGLDIADDGKIICRSDAGALYGWSGTVNTNTNEGDKWQQLCSYTAVGATLTQMSKIGGIGGCWDARIAPSNTNKLYAIFKDITHVSGPPTYAVYYSSNFGTSWTKSNLSFQNADPNGSWKAANYKIAVDPVNENIIYCGTPSNGSLPSSLYAATDGHRFSAVSGFTSLPTIMPGCCGIVFDKNYGRTTVGGKTVSARIIVPVSSVDVFESINGGQTWSSTGFATAFGSGKFGTTMAVMDFDGVVYLVAHNNSGSVSAGSLWRYSPSAARGPSSGTGWIRLDTRAGWSGGTNFIGQLGTVVVDERKGQQGYLTVIGQSGLPKSLNSGFTSLNANAANPALVRWGGTSGGTMTFSVASYEPKYVADSFSQGANVFTYGTCAKLDPNGTMWWGGGGTYFFQGGRPNWASGTTHISTAVIRGQEATISQVNLMPPGAKKPLMGTFDVGLMQSDFVNFPSSYYVSGKRMDCASLEYAASDPAFIVASVTSEAVFGKPNAFRAYSSNYGTNWTPYTTQPDFPMYGSNVQGFVDDGSSFPNPSGIAGKVLTVTAVNSGRVKIGQWVNTNAIILRFLGNGVYGGAGQYNLTSSNFVLAPGIINMPASIHGGFAVAVDHDHHVLVPYGRGGNEPYVPVYTTNATSPSITWNYCSGLPEVGWGGRNGGFGGGGSGAPKPFAVGYGGDLGKVFAIQTRDTSGAVITPVFWQSDDSGATFSSSGKGTPSPFPPGMTLPYLLSVPGYPGELWLSALVTGGSTGAIFHTTDYGVTWNSVTRPTGRTCTRCFCLGAPQTPGGYPTLYLVAWNGVNTIQYLYYATDGDVNPTNPTWQLFGTTGTFADQPLSVQPFPNYTAIAADWNLFKRVFVANGSQGYSFYQP